MAQRSNPSQGRISTQDNLPWADTGGNAKRTVIIGGVVLTLFIVAMIAYRILSYI